MNAATKINAPAPAVQRAILRALDGLGLPHQVKPAKRAVLR
jgi:hypothetical protein